MQSSNYRFTGQVFLDDRPIYDQKMDVVALRKKIGLIFQKPAPFPMSIYDNVAFALRIHGEHQPDQLDKLVKDSLQQVNL